MRVVGYVMGALAGGVLGIVFGGPVGFGIRMLLPRHNYEPYGDLMDWMGGGFLGAALGFLLGVVAVPLLIRRKEKRQH